MRARLTADQRPVLVSLGTLALLSTLAFANSFWNDFAYDDEPLIVKNRLIKHWTQFPALFTTGYWAGTRDEIEPSTLRGTLYRPLVLLTFTLNNALGGLDPFGYHLLNLLLHLAVSVLVYALACQLGLPWDAALVGAAVFAVHPLHTEAVTGVVGRAELLLALGVLLALRWYHRSGAPARVDARYILASLAAFLVALLSKEQAMVLPALLLLADLGALRETKEPPQWKGVIRGMLSRYGVYLLVLVAFLMLRMVFLGIQLQRPTEKISFTDNPLAHVSWDVRVLTALKVAGRYLWLLVWPSQLSADYSYNALPLAASPWEPEVVLSGLAWGGLLALMIYAFLRRIRPLVFGLGLVALTFLPVSNVLVLIGTIMGERLFYLPSVGLCLAVGVAWERVWARTSLAGRRPWLRGAALGLVSVVVLLLTARTIQRNRDWRDTETLFQSAFLVMPESTKVRFTMGLFELKHGNAEGALREFEQAIRIYPKLPARKENTSAALGEALLKLGRGEEAIEALERAVRLQPKLQEAHYNLGLAYAMAERWLEAEAAYRKALALNQNNPDAHVSLGGVLLKLGQVEEAIETLEWAGRLKPQSQEAFYNLGLAYAIAQRWPEAEAAYQKALALNRSAPDPHNSLSFVLRQQERWAEALGASAEAIRLKPDFVEAHFNGARALEALGREREAVAAYERVLSLRPEFPAAVARLERLRARLGSERDATP